MRGIRRKTDCPALTAQTERPTGTGNRRRKPEGTQSASRPSRPHKETGHPSMNHRTKRQERQPPTKRLPGAVSPAEVPWEELDGGQERRKPFPRTDSVPTQKGTFPVPRAGGILESPRGAKGRGRRKTGAKTTCENRSFLGNTWLKGQ